MATISEIGIPGVGSGILQPKIRNRWRVLFQTPGSNTYDKNYQLNPISMQIVKVHLPQQDFTEGFFGLTGLDNVVQFEYEDDIINYATRVITEAGVERTKFDMIVQMLDGNEEVLEEIKFRNCTISQNQHLAPLDYASGWHPDIEVKFNPDAFVGRLVDAVDGGDEMMKMLHAFFYNLKATVNLNREPRLSAAVHRIVTVAFETREDVYAPKPALK